MARLDLLPAKLDISGSVGDDLTVTFTVTENGSPWDATGATVTSGITDLSGTTVVTNFTTDASTGSLTLTLTDAQTTTLGAENYRYWVAVTKSGNTRTWVAGNLQILEDTAPGRASSSASLSITNGTVTLDFTSLVTPSSIWVGAQSINAQTGTSYTMLASDVGKLVTLSNASAIGLTVPSGLGLVAGQRIDLAQTGAGQVTVAGSGATVNATPGLAFRAQYSAATLICTATDTYLLVGDLSA